MLAPHVTGYLPYDERYGFLFNSYYKRLGPHPSRTTRGTFSRPTLDEVWSYRTHVDNIIRDLLDRGASPEVLRLLELGLNHEQQHQELIITDIKHAFWVSPVRPSYQPTQSHTPASVEPASAPPLAWFCFQGGPRYIGHDGSGFAFDNELPRHTVFIEPFCIASRLATNQEYQAFIADGGYRRPELWLSDGWDHVSRSGWTAPLYWEQTTDGWTQFTCRGTEPLRPAEPVCHVSFYEADAFARWAGMRLPTEFEWEIAASSLKNAGATGSNLLEAGTTIPALPGSRLAANGFAAGLWRCLGVDLQPLHRLSGLPSTCGRGRRIQWEIHVQPDGIARGLMRYPRIAHTQLLSQFLPAARALAILSHSIGS